MWQVAQVMSDSSNQMKRHIWTIGIVVVVVCCAAFFGVRGYQRRADLMHAALDSALELNRNYIPFTSDSTMLEVVEYFDRHGTPNDRLRAHYALGCVYRDLHDAPIALLTWEQGIAAADTTADNLRRQHKGRPTKGVGHQSYGDDDVGHDDLFAVLEYLHLGLRFIV